VKNSGVQVQEKENTCRVCGRQSEMTPFELFEVMFRTFETFRYDMCSDCGSMQIASIPSDLARYYPPNYYSIGGSQGSSFIHWIRSKGIRYAAGHPNLVGSILNLFDRLPSDSVWLRACRPQLNWRILDVGCGRGDRLREFALAGFTNLSGLDPFLETDIVVAPRVTVKRGTLSSIQGRFDLIMMHHSLEHVEDPRATLKEACRRITQDGKILVRVPVMGSLAWRQYGTDWVQLYQFTHKGICALAADCGLEVTNFAYDSFEFQFYGSENVRRARLAETTNRKFTRPEIKHFKKLAFKLNESSDGDQACFVLSRRKGS
jgi:SAM-dependent methyltransferase